MAICLHQRILRRECLHLFFEFELTLTRKLLLRVYGPQVEHLIDREAELQILRRLARKRIGPRMLGTFTNGRFEEYFHARALTPQELRLQDTSRQIAKRMRELHEGIDLLQSEREAGPFVWQNWDKWVNRVEQVATWLDQQILEGSKSPGEAPAEKWRGRGLVCGVEWPKFKEVVYKYREWLNEQYGGITKVNERLVFAHNDVRHLYGIATCKLTANVTDTIRKYPPNDAVRRVPSSFACK